MVDLSLELAGLKLKNPVMTASGTFGYGEEFAEHVDLNRLGAVVTKSISLAPRPGNPPQRIWETPAGMLNAIGLQNVGVEAFLEQKLPYLRRFDTKVIVNIVGETVGEYRKLAERLEGVEGVHAIEVNISCPNVEVGGMEFGNDPRLTFDLIAALRKATRLPLIAKLSPNVTDITVVARAAREAGADALSLVNTWVGMAIDPESWRPRLSYGTGGLSGPAIRPLAVRLVWQTARAVPLPVIGMGGIMTADDAVEFFLAGATAIAVGTANFVNPRATMEILEGIEAYLRQKGIASIKDLIGKVRVGESAV